MPEDNTKELFSTAFDTSWVNKIGMNKEFYVNTTLYSRGLVKPIVERLQLNPESDNKETTFNDVYAYIETKYPTQPELHKGLVLGLCVIATQEAITLSMHRIRTQKLISGSIFDFFDGMDKLFNKDEEKDDE